MQDIADLQALLAEVVVRNGNDFSGVGVIVSPTASALPLFPLRPANPNDLHRRDSVAVLSEVARLESSFHDGFHVLSKDLSIVYVAQYFSPPIVKGVRIPTGVKPGGRYMAALFGSFLPAVDVIGIVGVDRQLSIFRRGKVVRTEFVK